MNNIIMKPGSEKITKFGILKSVLDSDSNHLFNDEYNMYDWNIEPEKCSKCCFNKISCNVEDFQPMVSKTKFLGIEKETNTTYYFFCSEMPEMQNNSVYYIFEPFDSVLFKNHINSILNF